MMEYHLPCGRTVRVEEFRLSISMLGFLAGNAQNIREKVIKDLPARVRAQFPGNYGLTIKPVPDGELPIYVMMAVLSCDQPVSDPSSDFSSLIICWLGDDIEASLTELISREIVDLQWGKHAVDGCF